MCERQRKRESRRRANVLLVCRGSRSQSRTNIIIHYIFYFIFSSSLSRSLSLAYAYICICIYYAFTTYQPITSIRLHLLLCFDGKLRSLKPYIQSTRTRRTLFIFFFFEYLYLCLFPVHFPLLSFSSCVRVSKQREACDKF